MFKVSLFSGKKRRRSNIEHRLGYRFKHPEILQLALTHRSLKNEDDSIPESYSNERLEFLGDAVLELVVAANLFSDFPESEEGDLTEMRRILVNGKFLARKAIALDLGKEIRMSVGEKESGGMAKSSILADTYEAILGAIFIDGGIDAAKRFIEKFHLTDRDKHLNSRRYQNFKGLLLERLQAEGKQPEYRILSETGPDHKKLFEIGVFLKGNKIGHGTGKSKKSAEKSAARDAVSRMSEH